MKKIDKIFMAIIILELLVFLPSLFFQDSCASPCSKPSLLNPLGLDSSEACIEVCVESFYTVTYVMLYLIIITLIAYSIPKFLKGGF